VVGHGPPSQAGRRIVSASPRRPWPARYEGLSRLVEQEWREVWLDYNLGTGLTIEPVLRLLEERATRGRPIPIGLICVHTSGSAEGDAMIAALTPWYRVQRVVAHSFRAPS
jgi:hypothetical protein